MSQVGTNKTALIQSMNHEYKKQHYVYLGDGRMDVLYEAPVDTANSGSCLGTKFSYVGATTVLAGSVEFAGTWSSAWDISYP